METLVNALNSSNQATVNNNSDIAKSADNGGGGAGICHLHANRQERQ